jgi:DNA-directed RNA polymerase specialized sigma24 family protein
LDFFRKFKRDEGIYLHEKEKKIAEFNANYDSDCLYEQSDLRDLIGSAVENLIESRKKVVKLYLLNLSIEEISLYFRWSPHKTRNLLYRGLLDLKNILKEKKINYEHQP